MENVQRTYIAIDLKSFYASVECAERGLDPLNTNLVVADVSRTEKTICLAVSPSLKAYGISGRARLFEVVQRVSQVNKERLLNAPGRHFSGKSSKASEITKDSSLELDYIAAKPRMGLYMKVSTEIYRIYLKYVAPEDIHVYSIDEVFIDATSYLKTYRTTPHELARLMISDVLRQTHITATAGIGTNMYLAKVAMDIVAKHIPADKDGVRIAELNEMSYRRTLWEHTPITDFWRVGKGYAARLESIGILTMGDIALCSLENEDKLYELLGVNAELLIDHAWGWEPCRISDIKAYRPDNNSLSSGQVMHEPYPFDKARLIVREMTDALALELVAKRLATDQIWLDIAFDSENLDDRSSAGRYKGEIKESRYGRMVPKPVHGSCDIGRFTSSSRLLTDAADEIFCEKVNRLLTVRRITVTANHVIPEEKMYVPEDEECEETGPVQLDLFSKPLTQKAEHKEPEHDVSLDREKNVQLAMIDIKRKYGKNSVLKAMNLQEGATARDRNSQIGGHKA